MSVPTTSKYFMNAKPVLMSKNSNNVMAEKTILLVSESETVNASKSEKEAKSENGNLTEPGFENSNLTETENAFVAKSVNETNKNVTSDKNTSRKKNTIKSKYFQNEKWSLEQPVTTSISRAKSLSEKISDNIASANNSDIPINSESCRDATLLTNHDNVSRVASDIVTENRTPGNTSSTANSTQQLIENTNAELITISKKAKRKRFDGVPEAKILNMTLPDLIAPNLDVLIVGINPGLETAYRQHYYAGPGNHFWQCMALAGILPSPMTAEDDTKLNDIGIGFTNVVERTTRGQADLSKKELLEGCAKLREKIVQFKPKIVAFNGKYIYELFSGGKEFSLGLQPGVIGEGIDAFQFVMPSSSARCSHLPRAQDKVPFFKGLKKMLDLVRGDIDKVEDEDVKFPIKLTTGKKRTNLQSKS